MRQAGSASIEGGRSALWFDAGGAVRTITDLVRRARGRTPASRSVLAAVTGIDGCGKGFLSGAASARLRSAGLNAAVINIDGWLNLPPQRFSDTDPAGTFYRNAIRFDDMFAQLVLPLRERRSVCIEADFAEEAAPAFRRHIYEYREIDAILLEGIHLLKREFQDRYDVSFWIDCTFATALERAIARAQEGLPPAATIEAYRTIYFPAQEIHFERDDPRRAATEVLINDAWLSALPAGSP